MISRGLVKTFAMLEMKFELVSDCCCFVLYLKFKKQERIVPTRSALLNINQTNSLGREMLLGMLRFLAML